MSIRLGDDQWRTTADDERAILDIEELGGHIFRRIAILDSVEIVAIACRAGRTRQDRIDQREVVPVQFEFEQPDILLEMTRMACALDDGGYGWLPYEYVLKGQAVDWWSLIQAEWVDTGQFA